jgi:hypothetical protein
VKVNTVREFPEAGLMVSGAAAPGRGGEPGRAGEPELWSPLASAKPETVAIPATTTTASALSHMPA